MRNSFPSQLRTGTDFWFKQRHFQPFSGASTSSGRTPTPSPGSFTSTSPFTNPTWSNAWITYQCPTPATRTSLYTMVKPPQGSTINPSCSDRWKFVRISFLQSAFEPTLESSSDFISIKTSCDWRSLRIFLLQRFLRSAFR